MARTRSILHVRDSTSLVFTYRRNNPATGLYFDNVAITACTVEVRNGETGASILAPAAMSFDANRDGYFLAWSYAALLDGVRSITVRFVPTRAVSTPAALAPSASEDYDLSDIEKDVDEAAASVLAAEVVTQSKVDMIGASSEAQLLAPADFAIPTSGTKMFVLEFILKDLDNDPVVLVDPDGNSVTITAKDQTGAAPTGVALAAAGAMARFAAGSYTLVVTVDSAAVDLTQVRFSAAYSRLGAANVAKAMTILAVPQSGGGGGSGQGLDIQEKP